MAVHEIANLEQIELKLLPPNQRYCLRCGKLFTRKRYISNYKWETAHKLCSRACCGNWADHRNGIHLRYRQHLFQCSTCHCEIIGNKGDLKKHKQEVHSY